MPSKFETRGGDVSGNLRQSGGIVVRVVNDRMEDAMTQVRDEAKRRVPEDHGDLMAAIKLEKENRRRTWTVGVDYDMPNDTGGTVGDYAMRIHEGVPDYNLGPKSILKGVPNEGRKFLENPFREIINQDLIDKLSKLVSEALERRNRYR